MKSRMSWREAGCPGMPSQRFGVNGAWFKLSLLAYNAVSAIKGLCLEGEERTVRLKKFRLLVIHLAGRMNRNNCVMGLRLCADAKAVKRMQKVWEAFALATQATSVKARGGARRLGERKKCPARKPLYRMGQGGSVYLTAA